MLKVGAKMKSMKERIHQANTEQNLEKKVELFSKLAVSYWHQSDLKNSKKFAQLTLNMAQNNNLQNLEASALNTLGLINVSSNNYDKALNYFLQTLNVYKKIDNNPAIAISLGNVGLIYLNMNDTISVNDLMVQNGHGYLYNGGTKKEF